MREPSASAAPLGVEAFLAWSEGRAGRYELLDGEAVAMVGRGAAVGSAERAVHARLKYALTLGFSRAIAEAGLSCEAFVDGMAVRVDEGTVFEPDALVRCGAPLADEAVLVTDPVIVAEVGSPSSQRIDALLKLTRYFNNPVIMHHLIVLPGERSVVHHRRAADGGIATAIVRSGRLLLDPPGLALDVGVLFARDAAMPREPD